MHETINSLARSLNGILKELLNLYRAAVVSGGEDPVISQESC